MPLRGCHVLCTTCTCTSRFTHPCVPGIFLHANVPVQGEPLPARPCAYLRSGRGLKVSLMISQVLLANHTYRVIT